MPVTRPAPGKSSSYTPCAASARELEERRSGIEQRIHPLAHQQLAGLAVLVARRGAAAQRVAREQRAQLRHQRRMAARLAANSGERTSMFEAILAMSLLDRLGRRPLSFRAAEAQNCRTVRLSNDFGSDDNGVVHMPGAAYREFNFGLGEEIDAVRDQVRRFAEERIAPRATEIDRSNVFPRDLWRELGELGLLGMTVPAEHGGAGLGYLAHIVAMEEISRASAAVGLELRRALQSLREPDRAECHRGAEAPLSAEASERRTRGLARHVRARRGLGCRVDAAAGAEARRPLRARRPQDVDHQRPGGRRAGGVCEDRAARPARAASAPFSSSADLRDSRPRRSSTSSACAARAPASSCSTAARCRRRTCSARRTRA